MSLQKRRRTGSHVGDEEQSRGHGANQRGDAGVASSLLARLIQAPRTWLHGGSILVSIPNPQGGESQGRHVAPPPPPRQPPAGFYMSYNDLSEDLLESEAARCDANEAQRSACSRSMDVDGRTCEEKDLGCTTRTFDFFNEDDKDPLQDSRCALVPTEEPMHPMDMS